MLVIAEWYIYFQLYWVQNIMALIFAIIFAGLTYYEINSKDKLIIRIVPSERPSPEVFDSDVMDSEGLT